MKSSKEYIESGLLELYVLGQTSPEQTATIEQLAAADKTIRQEITEIELTLEKYAQEHSIEPDPIIKPFLLAMIDYSDRLQNGEETISVPLLHQNSVISDYNQWLMREDMVLPDNFQDVYAKIISRTADAVTAIVWIKEMAPQEVHDDEFEKFLIVEGACTITIGKKAHHLVAGDILTIPLHTKHHVEVTSAIPCKVILQRVAA